jgi:hypothetical protein
MKEAFMKRRSACLVALFTLGLTSVAHAAELITPPLYPDFSDWLECSIVNVTSRPKTVRIRVIDSGGTVHSDSGDVELAAGQIASRSVLGQFIIGDGYCRFIVEGGKAGYRAVAKVGGSSGSDRVAVRAE